jgi:hypothetical protein
LAEIKLNYLKILIHNRMHSVKIISLHVEVEIIEYVERLATSEAKYVISVGNFGKFEYKVNHR